MNELSTLGLQPTPDGLPPMPDPELLLPLGPDESFFKTLPQRRRARPGPLTVALLVHVVMLGFLAWYDRKAALALAKELNGAREAMMKGKPGAAGEPGEIPVKIVPRLPPGLAPQTPPRSARPMQSAPGAVPTPAPPTPPAQEPRYTHIVQDEQAERKSPHTPIYSDRDRAGAAPTSAPHADPRNPDPHSEGRDARRMAMSAPGPDRPGEPGTQHPSPEDHAAAGSNGEKGENGQNGSAEQPRGMPVFRRGGAIYNAGIPINNPGHGALRTGSSPGVSGPPGAEPNSDGQAHATGGAGKVNPSPLGPPGKSGKPGDPGSGSDPGAVTIRQQLAAMARDGAASTFHNPGGRNVSLGAFSFDSQGFDLGDYDRKMHQAVEREWNPPSGPVQRGERGCTLLSFTIERNGRVSEVSLLATSGLESYDRAAMTALRNAILPPLPAKMTLEHLTGRSAFFINEQESDQCGTPVKGAAGAGPEP